MEITEIKKLLKTIVASKQEIVIVDGFRVKNRERYKFFLQTGVFCKCCKRNASFIRIEKDSHCKTGLYHLSFYINDGNKEIKLTIDHIVPRAMNGENCIENYQILCEKCNRDKGDTIIDFSLPIA